MTQDEVNALKGFATRIRAISTERQLLAEDIKEVYVEADGRGFDKKALKLAIRALEQDPDEREVLENTVEAYLQAIS